MSGSHSCRPALYWKFCSVASGFKTKSSDEQIGPRPQSQLPGPLTMNHRGRMSTLCAFRRSCYLALRNKPRTALASWPWLMNAAIVDTVPAMPRGRFLSNRLFSFSLFLFKITSHNAFPLTSNILLLESACQCRRRGFHPQVGKISWRRKW